MISRRSVATPWCPVVLAAVVCALGGRTAGAQTAFAAGDTPSPGVARAAEARELRADLDALRSEVDDLRRQVRVLTGLLRDGQSPASHAPASRAAGPSAPDAEPRSPVRITGTILSTSAYNSSDIDVLDHPTVVGTARGGSMTSSLRQSRIGAVVAPFALGTWQASGHLDLDFSGGTPATATGAVMALPRLVTAVARFERGARAVVVGQDQVIFAPRDPTSLAALAVPQFYRSGNPFLRAPQVRVEQRIGARLTAAGSVVAPVTGEVLPAYAFAPPPGAGERSELPALEARVSYALGDADGPAELQLGASSHVGWLRQFGSRVTASGGALDLVARAGRLGMTGEIFVTDDLDAFGTGVAQPGRAAGGWLELRGAVLPRLSVTGGAGLDRRPDGPGNAGQSRNASAFGNVIVRLAPAVSTSLEYRWLQTRYASGRDRVNHHVTAVMALRF